MKNTIAGLAAVLALSTAPVHATVIAPANVTGEITAPALDSSFGRLDLALNFGGGDLTRDGISFQGVLSPGGSPISLVNTPFVVEMSGSEGGLLNASFGTDPLFESEIFALSYVSLFSQTLTISGLDPSRVYQFQFLHGDTRIGSFNEWNDLVSFTDSQGNVAQTALLFGTAGSAAGAPYALINVTVSGSTSLEYFMPTDGPRGSSMSGMAIHSVPEPGTLALLGLGLAGLGFARRRKTA